MKENAIETELVRRVEALGGVCLKVTVIGSRGFFDRLIILPGGRIIFVECKRPRGGRLAAHQMWYADMFRKLGVGVACVKNLEDITRLLRAVAAV